MKTNTQQTPRRSRFGVIRFIGGFPRLWTWHRPISTHQAAALATTADRREPALEIINAN